MSPNNLLLGLSVLKLTDFEKKEEWENCPPIIHFWNKQIPHVILTWKIILLIVVILFCNLRKKKAVLLEDEDSLGNSF